MTTAPVLDLADLADTLRKMGYDIEPETPERGRPAGRAITARRELGEHAVLVVVDHSGRMRVSLTWLVGEWPAQVAVGGIPFRSVDRVAREITLTAQVSTVDEAGTVVADLGSVEPWAAPRDVADAPMADLPPLP
jgi:hypothetical protein